MKTERLKEIELFADIMRAEESGNDLIDNEAICRIMVCAQRKDGTVYELGSVCMLAAKQNPEAARVMVSRIKFERNRNEKTKRI